MLLGAVSTAVPMQLSVSIDPLSSLIDVTLIIVINSSTPSTPFPFAADRRRGLRRGRACQPLPPRHVAAGAPAAVRGAGEVG